MKKTVPLNKSWLDYNCDICRRSVCSVRQSVRKTIKVGYITQRSFEYIGNGSVCENFTTVRIMGKSLIKH